MAQPQINHATRRAYAELLRHFLAGRMTTDQYEDAYFDLQKKGSDSAVEHVFAACWHLYDDIIPHRMTGRNALDPATRRRAARWILFLRSGAEYAGDDISPDHAGRSYAVRTRAGGRIWASIFATLLIGGILIWSGVAAGYLVVMVAVVAHVMMAMARVGVSINSNVFARAFCDDADSWPFASDSLLRQTVSHPTYLCGLR